MSGQLNKAQLQKVYTQSILQDAQQNYSFLSPQLQILRAIEDFCAYIDEFLLDKGALYAVWVVDGAYVAALRIEPYRDGYLLSGLETAPELRRNGYATRLIREVQKHFLQFGSYKLYSHVDKRNKPSLRVHHNCGFTKIFDYAVYLDGSVSQNAYTLSYES